MLSIPNIPDLRWDEKTFLPDGQVVRHINISKDEGIGIYMRIYGSKEELDLS